MTITADVASVSPSTGLPATLSGVLSGAYEGTYSEFILEVYTDGDGLPIAALSRSVFTIDTPETGTLTSLNLIVVQETLVGDDGSGVPVPIGLRTRATGEIVYGTGAYEGAAGELQTDSTILFGGGEFGLGTLSSDVALSLELSSPTSNGG